MQTTYKQKSEMAVTQNTPSLLIRLSSVLLQRYPHFIPNAEHKQSLQKQLI